MTPKRLAALVDLVEQTVINNNAAQKVFAQVIKTGQEPITVVEELGLQQIASVDELESIVKNIIINNPDTVAQYKGGKERLFGFFVGQAMQTTKGKGNPTVLTELFKKHLA